MTNPAFQVPKTAQQQDKFAAAVHAALQSSRLRDQVALLCEQARFREYTPVRTDWGVAGVEETIHQFLKHGDTAKAEKNLTTNIDTSDALHDLTRSITATAIYDEIVRFASAEVKVECPDVPDSQVENRIAGAVLDLTIDEIRRIDPSKPFDALRGSQLNLVYVPSHDNRKQVTTSRTSWWGASSDATSIKPDQAFVEFMKLANVSKQSWLAGLKQAGFDIELDGDLSEGERAERRKAWADVDWTVSCEPVTDVSKIVHAVDLCPYGFTPFVAFSMDAFKIVNRKWSQAMAVTGGVLGLHDFAFGSGNPIRFEGNLILPAKTGNVVLHDRLKHNLSKVHGFTAQAFKSKFKDLGGEANSIALIEAKLIAGPLLPQIDLVPIARRTGSEFSVEIEELVDIIDATGLDPDAIDDAVKSALKERGRAIAGDIKQSTAIGMIDAEIARQTAQVSNMDTATKVSALVGLCGNDEAAETIKALSGYFNGPGM
jgi:hypothetical protein